ncbi:ATP-binding protein [Actinosynnema sp. CS-041913]|uniref:ATP-binding protein n=1 Tax=Actinosynnema sp. CS-041913 TaxID=3239917 RepID=UPI003D926211
MLESGRAQRAITRGAMVGVGNASLRAARERTASRTHPGECLSRQELAELVNEHVWRHHQRRVDVDANYVAKLERGVIRWPNAHYRAAFRAVLGASTDAELGFANNRRAAVPLATNTGSAPTTRGPVHPPPAVPAPRQLPAAPRLFSGRTRELAALSAAADGDRGRSSTVVISAIDGLGGIGKTWLALQWAHQNLARFPDGQLYVNLRGFAPTEPPVAPTTAVRGFLHALGVAPTAVPPDLDGRTALFRSLVAGKRMLVVLDDAPDDAVVEHLLPGSPSCTVLVTSRRRLAGLTVCGAHRVMVDALGDDDARALLEGHIGRHRFAAEPDAITDLVRFCAGLPLAVSIVAARAVTHPDFPLGALADDLRDRAARLDELSTADRSKSLSAVFAASLQAQNAPAATLFRLLGVAGGPDIGVPAAAGLAGLTVSRTRRLLRELEDAHLVQQHQPGRFRMHDLVRLFATDRAARDLDPGARASAARRLVDHYLHTSFAGERVFDPVRPPIDIGHPVSGSRPGSLPDETAALAWFEAEHQNILSTQRLADRHDLHSHVWQLAWASHTFHYRQGHRNDSLTTWRAALVAADRLGDGVTRARIHRRLGVALVDTGDHGAGLEHLRQALSLFTAADDGAGQARAHEALADAWERHGDAHRALTHAYQALQQYRNLGDAVHEANALNSVGWYHARQGHYEQARAYCTNALALHQEHHYHDGEAYARHSLGCLAHVTGDHAHAIEHFRRSLTLLRQLKDAHQEATVVDDLGTAHAALHDHRRARANWLRALDLYRAQHREAEAASVEHRLASLEAPAPGAGVRAGRSRTA